MSGCNISSQPEERTTVNFSIFESTKAKPIKIKDKKPLFSKEKSEQFSSIMDGFTKNASKRFGDPELAKHIDRIEAIYIESGRYLELTKLYEDEYEKEGLKAKMVGHLVFAYIRLGQDKAARDLMDKIGSEGPKDADYYFLEGSFWMRQARTIPNLTKALNAWKKVLELKPDYIGFEGIDKKNIQSIIDRLQQVVPKDATAKDPKAEKVDEGKDAPETAPKVEKETPPVAEKTTIEKKEEEPKVEKVDVEKIEGGIEKAVQKAEPIKAPQRSPEDEYKINIAMAEIAVSEGKFDKADRYYAAAKALKPDGFEAEFGPLRAKWRFEPARNKIAVSVRKLAKKKLNAKQTYQVALFVYSNMGVKKLARNLFESVKSQDPLFAEKVGLDRLLEKVK